MVFWFTTSFYVQNETGGWLEGVNITLDNGADNYTCTTDSNGFCDITFEGYRVLLYQ